MASSSVDLPDPFSPTRNVTGFGKTRLSICATAGSANGYRLRSEI
jgi:hypothetical protein